jgi:DNA-binding MarR family transcriptional regulator
MSEHPTQPKLSRPAAGQQDGDSGPASPFGESIFRSLRRMIRAIDLHSRETTGRSTLTVPQLVCLRQIWMQGPTKPSQLARAVFLSQATVTGILDRLENRGLIQRQRDQADRRLVTISLTRAGADMASSLPIPLQDGFARRLAALSLEEQADIDRILERVVEMMEGTSRRHGLRGGAGLGWRKSAPASGPGSDSGP